MILNIRSDFVGKDPESNIEAVRSKFPTGICPMYGWECHTPEKLQFEHFWITLTSVPLMSVMSATHLSVQIGQAENSWSSWLSKTMNFLSFTRLRVSFNTNITVQHWIILFSIVGSTGNVNWLLTRRDRLNGGKCPLLQTSLSLKVS